ncbi:MAG: hypothetical protein EPO32_05160 [Anaerolineae bacterium]|nr:MAG: hypothetical protein EPO32_05160 [Anaerolineae bacterium]
MLSSCSQGTPVAPASSPRPSKTPPAATATPLPPTETPTATATETPAETAEPTRIPPPTEDTRLAGLTLPRPIDLYLNNVVLTRWETFGETQDPADLFSGNLETLGAGLTYSQESDSPKPGIPLRQQFPGGKGLLFLFNYESGTRATITYRHNRSSEPAGARLGISFNRNSVTFSAALGDYRYNDFLVGNLNIVPGHWYYLLLAVGEDGKGIALVWDFEDPAHSARTTFLFDPPGEEWSLAVDVTRNAMLFDNYAEFTFTTVK